MSPITEPFIILVYLTPYAKLLLLGLSLNSYLDLATVNTSVSRVSQERNANHSSLFGFHYSQLTLYSFY